MKITVTQEHIDNGEISARSCPIALALIDSGYQAPWVGHRGMVWFDGLVCGVELSRRARRFIKRFDEGQPVEPFAFELVVPQ